MEKSQELKHEEEEEVIPVAENHCHKYASKILRDNKLALVMSKSLQDDYKLLADGHAVYLKGFMCKPDDMGILQGLMKDLEANSSGFIQWSKVASSLVVCFFTFDLCCSTTNTKTQTLAQRSTTLSREWPNTLAWKYMRRGSTTITTAAAGNLIITILTLEELSLKTEAKDQERTLRWVLVLEKSVLSRFCMWSLRQSSSFHR